MCERKLGCMSRKMGRCWHKRNVCEENGVLVKKKNDACEGKWENVSKWNVCAEKEENAKENGMLMIKNGMTYKKTRYML